MRVRTRFWGRLDWLGHSRWGDRLLPDRLIFWFCDRWDKHLGAPDD